MQASASIIPTPNLDTPTIVLIGQITLSPALRATHAHFSHLNAYIWVSTKHSAAEGGGGAVIVGFFVQHTGPTSSFSCNCIGTIYLVTFNNILLIITIIFTDNSPHNCWCAD